MGAGEAANNAKTLEKVAAELYLSSGQKPLITKAKKSIGLASVFVKVEDRRAQKASFVVNAYEFLINWYHITSTCS